MESCLEKIDPNNFKNSRFFLYYYCKNEEQEGTEFIKTEPTNNFYHVIDFIIKNDLINNNNFFVYEENLDTNSKYIYDMNNIKKYINNLYKIHE